MTRVAIIGGGITGLSAAWHLQQQQIPFTLYEASDRVGGAIRTHHEADCLIEAGPNSLSGPNPQLDRLIEQLNLTSELCPANADASNRFIVRNGTPHPLPRTPLQFLQTPLFSAAAKWRLLQEPFIRTQSPPNETLADFAQRRLGREPLDYALAPFVGGIYAGNPHTLSAAAAFPTLIEMEAQHHSLIKAMLHRAKQQRKAGKPREPRTIYTFKNGMQTLPDRIAEQLHPHIQLHQPVHHIQPLAQHLWNIHGEEYTDIILTLPAHTQPQLDTPFDLSFLQTIRHPAVTSLTLLYEKQQLTHPLNGFGMLVPPCENRFILGVLFPHSIFPDRAPPQHALLTVFIGGDLHPQRANLPLEELLPLVENDLQHLLGLTGSPRHTSLHRWPNAIPQYTLDIPAIHQQLNHIETHHPGIHFAGTYRHGISISNALTSGETIAQRIMQSPRKEYGTTST